MKIYLVRHGESTSDIKQRYDGDYDDHLTEKGKKEAAVVAQKMLNRNIAHIFSSSRIRAVETSEIIAHTLGLHITVMDDLKEQDIYTAFQQLSIHAPEEEYRRLGEIQITRENAPKGTEAYEDFKIRVINSFMSIARAQSDNIIIVTHGGPIRCVFREFIHSCELKKISNGAIVELEKIDQGYMLKSFDDGLMQ